MKGLFNKSESLHSSFNFLLERVLWSICSLIKPLFIIESRILINGNASKSDDHFLIDTIYSHLDQEVLEKRNIEEPDEFYSLNRL